MLCVSALLVSVALLNSCSSVHEEIDSAIRVECSRSFALAFDAGQPSDSVLEIAGAVSSKEKTRVRVINCTPTEGIDDAVALILSANGYMNVVCSDARSLESEVSLVSWQNPFHAFFSKDIALLLEISLVGEQYFDPAARVNATGRTADDQIVVSIGYDRAFSLVG